MSDLSLLEAAREWVQNLFQIEDKEVRFEMEEVESKGIIPAEYQARFELVPLHDAGQLEGRDMEMEAIGQAWKNWSATKNPMLVVGEAGCGMTSLLNASCVHFPHACVLGTGEPVRNHQDLVAMLAQAFRLENITKLDDILEHVNQTEFESTPVIVLENIERLFRRKVNGFNLLEDFLLFMHGTKRKVFWIISVNQYAAYYLNQVRNFAGNFPTRLLVSPLKSDFIKTLIEDRNKGYEWMFLKPESAPAAFMRNLAKATPEEKQEMLRTNFFKRLHDFAEGNISIALLFVAGSVWHVKEKKVLMRAFSPKPIGDLEKEDLFLAEAILQHYAITPGDLNQVMIDNGKGAALKLQRLMERSLVKLMQPADGPDYFRIDLLHLHRVKAALRNKLNRKVK